ncbi:MAG: 3-hydroxyacyl-ACP dehydratase FabZ [Holosporaceae bacterium]|jgi:3-hydroxyacyl-[acyl-carrier-protein] dehydratase|nr:3-hydroxyacyl-ACP dehydratase FabZ [Holosporaceae bacterium]
MGCDSEVLDINQIKKLLPHRYPMLMIDRVEDLVPGESAVGVKSVSANEPFFPGHFPEKAVMPGIFIVEAMGQTAGVTVATTTSAGQGGGLVYFMTMDKVKFRKMVVPGDVLRLCVKKDRSRGNVWRFQGEAYVGDMLVAEATFAAMIDH